MCDSISVYSCLIPLSQLSWNYRYDVNSCFFAMMYRNPAVALMPDITPKPLRSKANGMINIMGYLGGACATLVGLVFVLSEYLGGSSSNNDLWATNQANIWIIESPF